MKSILAAFLSICVCLPAIGDEKKDFDYLKAKADKGDSLYQAYVAQHYQFGLGVEKSYTKALEWMRKAANQGGILGQIMLGDMHKSGTGVPEDMVAAYAWYNIAAAKGDKKRGSEVRFLKLQLSRRMTADQIAKAQELSSKMVKKNPRLLNKKP